MFDKCCSNRWEVFSAWQLNKLETNILFYQK